MNRSYLDEWQKFYFKMYKSFQNDTSALITVYYFLFLNLLEHNSEELLDITFHHERSWNNFIFHAILVFLCSDYFLNLISHLHSPLTHSCGVGDCLAWSLAASRDPRTHPAEPAGFGGRPKAGLFWWPCGANVEDGQAAQSIFQILSTVRKKMLMMQMCINGYKYTEHEPNGFGHDPRSWTSLQICRKTSIKQRV